MVGLSFLSKFGLGDPYGEAIWEEDLAVHQSQSHTTPHHSIRSQTTSFIDTSSIHTIENPPLLHKNSITITQSTDSLNSKRTSSVSVSISGTNSFQSFNNLPDTPPDTPHRSSIRPRFSSTSESAVQAVFGTNPDLSPTLNSLKSLSLDGKFTSPPRSSSRSPSPSRSIIANSQISSTTGTEFSMDVKSTDDGRQIEQCYTEGPPHSGIPQGQEETIGNFEVYIARPNDSPILSSSESQTSKNESDRVIIIFCDVFGWKYKNTRIMADKIALNGFTVFIPDFYEKDILNFEKPYAHELYNEWIQRHSPQHLSRLAQRFIDAIQSRFKPIKIGTLGYSIASRYAIQLNGQNRVQATVIAHPAHLSTEDIASVTHPLLLLCAEYDRAFCAKERAAAVEVLANKPFNSSLVFYPGTEHGFCVRYHEQRVDVAKASKDALEKTIGFFIANLS